MKPRAPSVVKPKPVQKPIQKPLQQPPPEEEKHSEVKPQPKPKAPAAAKGSGEIPIPPCLTQLDIDNPENQTLLYSIEYCETRNKQCLD